MLLGGQSDPATVDPKEDEAARKRRRDMLLALLLLLIGDTRDRMRQSVGAWAAGTLTLDNLLVTCTQDLTAAHSHAAYLGRRLAGVTQPIGPLDQQFGEATMGTEQRFLSAFITDLGSGKYLGETQPDGTASVDIDAVKRRAGLYALKLRGTANQAWGMALPLDALLYWLMEGPEPHCHNCPELQARNPYTVQTIPTWPGFCETECVFWCRCVVRDAEGNECYPPITSEQFNDAA